MLRSLFMRGLTFSTLKKINKKLEMSAIWSETFFMEISRAGLNN